MTKKEKILYILDELIEAAKLSDDEVILDLSSLPMTKAEAYSILKGINRKSPIALSPGEDLCFFLDSIGPVSLGDVVKIRCVLFALERLKMETENDNEKQEPLHETPSLSQNINVEKHDRNIMVIADDKNERRTISTDKMVDSTKQKLPRKEFNILTTILADGMAHEKKSIKDPNNVLYKLRRSLKDSFDKDAGNWKFLKNVDACGKSGIQLNKVVKRFRQESVDK